MWCALFRAPSPSIYRPWKVDSARGIQGELPINIFWTTRGTDPWKMGSRDHHKGLAQLGVRPTQSRFLSHHLSSETLPGGSSSGYGESFGHLVADVGPTIRVLAPDLSRVCFVPLLWPHGSMGCPCGSLSLVGVMIHGSMGCVSSSFLRINHLDANMHLDRARDGNVSYGNNQSSLGWKQSIVHYLPKVQNLSPTMQHIRLGSARQAHTRLAPQSPLADFTRGVPTYHPLCWLRSSYLPIQE